MKSQFFLFRKDAYDHDFPAAGFSKTLGGEREMSNSLLNLRLEMALVT